MNELTTDKLIAILRRVAQVLMDVAAEVEVDSIPRGAHYLYGTATGFTVILECSGLTATCPIINGMFGYDANTLSIPAAYGTHAGAQPGDIMRVYVDGALKAQVPFVEKGLTELHL